MLKNIFSGFTSKVKAASAATALALASPVISNDADAAIVPTNGTLTVSGTFVYTVGSEEIEHLLGQTYAFTFELDPDPVLSMNVPPLFSMTNEGILSLSGNVAAYSVNAVNSGSFVVGNSVGDSYDIMDFSVFSPESSYPLGVYDLTVSFGADHTLLDEGTISIGYWALENGLFNDNYVEIAFDNPSFIAFASVDNYHFTPSTIPEPGHVAVLFGAAALGAAAALRRKRSAGVAAQNDNAPGAQPPAANAPEGIQPPAA